jgi:hypothetical protein
MTMGNFYRVQVNPTKSSSQKEIYKNVSSDAPSTGAIMHKE